MTDISDQFKKVIMRYKRIGYNINVSGSLSFGVQLVVSFAPVFQWYFFTPWVSSDVTIRFCRVLISDSS